MVDLVVAPEAMKVVVAWEQVAVSGLSFIEIHARADASQLLTLTFVDMRHRYGLWIGALAPARGTAALAPVPKLAGELAALPSRPRTATIIKTEHAVIDSIDERAHQMLGWTAEQMIGKRSTEFLHPEDHDRAVMAWLDLLANHGYGRVRTRHRCVDGTWLWIETDHTYVEASDDGTPPHVIAELTDITDEMTAHEELNRRERLFRRLAESMPVGILQLTGTRRVSYANHQLAETLGAPDVDSVDGLITAVTAAGRPALEGAIDAALRRGDDATVEVQVRRRSDGQLRTVTVTVIALSEDEGVPGALCCVVDVTEAALLREELRAQATFDALTGCRTRAAAMSHVDSELAKGGCVTAIFVDLDDFKPVNDQYGHDVGDQVLVRIASRLRDAAPSTGLVGRLGGDEFLVLIPGSLRDGDTVTLIDRIAATVAVPVELPMATLAIGASMGVALSRPGDDAASLVKRADHAMYAAKAKRKAAPRTTGEAIPAPRAMTDAGEQAATA